MNTKFGSFLATNLTEPADDNLKVRLGSEVLTSLGKFDCSISFYVYFLSGSSNTFRLKSREAVGGNEEILLEQAETTDFNYWIKKYVAIEEGITKFQLIIETEVLKNSTSTIFVDDISISPSCKSEDTSLPTVTPGPETTSDPCYFRCGNECLEQKQVCNFHHDCEDNSDEKNCGQCNFENDNCGWVDDSNGNFAWERTRPDDVTESEDEYPHKDHNDATDKFYLLANSKGEGTPDTAKLVSPLIGETASTCRIQYWFSTIRSVNELKLVILQDGNSLDEIVLEKEGGLWTHGTTSLNVEGSYYVSNFFVVITVVYISYS